MNDGDAEPGSDAGATGAGSADAADAADAAADDIASGGPDTFPTDDAAALLDALPCGVVVTDADGLVRSANAVFGRWLGRDVAGIVGSVRLSRLMSISGRMFHETHVRPMLELQGFVREISLRLELGAAGTLTVLLNGTARRAPDGTVGSVLWVLVDITERALYETTLRASRDAALYAGDVVASCPDPVFGLAADGTVLYCNPAAGRLPACRSPESMIGERLDTILRGDADDWFVAITRRLERGEARVRTRVALLAETATGSSAPRPATTGAGPILELWPLETAESDEGAPTLAALLREPFRAADDA